MFLSPTFQRLSKVDRLCHLKCICFNTYISRCRNRHLVVSLSVVTAAGIHNKHHIKKCYPIQLTLRTSYRTFASRGANYTSRTSYYDTLGLTPKATRTQIKSAYYKLSKDYHPDRDQRNPAAANKFSEINEAYSVLSNVTLRKRYDNGIYSPRDLVHGVKNEPINRKKEKKIQNTRSEVYNDQGERMYDFDEYFRAHYGEALKRERREKKRREKFQKEFENVNKMKENKAVLMGSLAVISMIVGLILSNF